MRMRIIAAVTVVGLGIVGITLAQQSGEDSRKDKSKLRAQLARLRAEVEVLQVEHDADSDILKKLMTDVRNVDCIEAVKGPIKEQMEALLKGPMKEQTEILKGQIEALKAPINTQLPGVPGASIPLQEELNKMFTVDEAMAKVGRPLLARLKKEFVQNATEMNEKRLELAEVEKRYNQAQ
jgi:hypothetical protein